jgi:hypothetical protein
MGMVICRRWNQRYMLSTYLKIAFVVVNVNHLGPMISFSVASLCAARL